MTEVCDARWRQVKARPGAGRGFATLVRDILMGGEKRFGLSCVIGNRDRERLEPRSQENTGSVGVPAGGCGFVRALGGRRVVGAFDGVLQRRPLPHSAASSLEKTGIAALGYGLLA